MKIAGYIKKPFSQYSIIVEELRRIKADIQKNKQLTINRDNMSFIQKLFNFLSRTEWSKKD